MPDDKSNQSNMHERAPDEPPAGNKRERKEAEAEDHVSQREKLVDESRRDRKH